MAHCFTPIRGRRMRVTKVNALGRPVYGPNSFVTTSGFVSVQFTPEIEEGEETTVKTAGGDICSPPGTQVQVVDPETGMFSTLSIEDVTTEHCVLSWAPSGHGGVLRKEGATVSRVGRRDYDGDLVTASLPSGASSSYTQNHICLAVIGDAFDSKAAVYVMRRDGDYRIGWTSRKDGNSNALADTIAEAQRQHADGVWMLSAHAGDGDAALGAALAQHEFSLPAQDFTDDDGPIPLDQFWAKVGNNRLDGARCVAAFGRDVEFPLWDASHQNSGAIAMWTRKPVSVRACNLMTGMLVCEVEHTPLAQDPIGTWRAVTIDRQPYAGTVYSLEVTKDHSFVADGIVTMNCVSEKACDALKWITVQIEFCQVDPCLFTLINETWTELRDCVGEVIGWAESHAFSCDSGFGLELWTDVTGYTPTTPGATSAFGYMLLPFIVGGTLGEQTVENGAVSFTITGRTKKGSGWGVGPFDVMCNDPVTGACGPLLTPVGPDEPRRIFLTTCPPPAALCGCQPLSSPDGPLVTVYEDPSVTTRMGVLASLPAGTAGQYKVSWGDTSAAQDLLPGAPLGHTYTAAGTYHVSVWDSANPQRITVRTVTVPFVGQIAPTITVTEDTSDTNRRTVSVTVDNHSNGPVIIDWGDGSATATNPGDGTTVTTHAYAVTPGQTLRTITARDQDNPTASAQEQVYVPFGQVKPVVTHSGSGQTVSLTVDNHGFGSVLIDWADEPAVPNSTNPGDGTTPSTRTYTRIGPVSIRVWDPNDLSTEVVHDLTLPLPQAVTPTIEVTEEPGDTTHKTARVTVTNPVTGRNYEVQWETGAAWMDIPATGTPPYSLVHQYTTAAGQKTVTVRDKQDTTKTAMQTVTIPFTPGVTPTLLLTEEGNPTPRRQVRVSVTNAAAGRTYEVLWEGSTWEDITPTGDWVTATHTYSSDGAKTVQVRDKVSPSSSAQETTPALPFQGPVFTVAQGSSAMQAVVTVIDPGTATFEAEWDTGTWTVLAGGTGNHTYTAAGVYEVPVRDQATPTVIASKQVRVPFPTAMAIAPEASAPAEDTTKSTASSRKRAK